MPAPMIRLFFAPQIHPLSSRPVGLVLQKKFSPPKFWRGAPFFFIGAPPIPMGLHTISKFQKKTEKDTKDTVEQLGGDETNTTTPQTMAAKKNNFISARRSPPPPVSGGRSPFTMVVSVQFLVMVVLVCSLLAFYVGHLGAVLLLQKPGGLPAPIVLRTMECWKKSLATLSSTLTCRSTW